MNRSVFEKISTITYSEVLYPSNLDENGNEINGIVAIALKTIRILGRQSMMVGAYSLAPVGVLYHAYQFVILLCKKIKTDSSDAPFLNNFLVDAYASIVTFGALTTLSFSFPKTLFRSVDKVYSFTLFPIILFNHYVKKAKGQSLGYEADKLIYVTTCKLLFISIFIFAALRMIWKKSSTIPLEADGFKWHHHHLNIHKWNWFRLKADEKYTSIAPCEYKTIAKKYNVQPSDYTITKNTKNFDNKISVYADPIVRAIHNSDKPKDEKTQDIQLVNSSLATYRKHTWITLRQNLLVREKKYI